MWRLRLTSFETEQRKRRCRFFSLYRKHTTAAKKMLFSPFTPLKNIYISLYPPNQPCVGLISSSKSKRGCIGLSSGAFHLYFPQSWLRWHRPTCRCRYNLACCSEQTAVKRHVLLDSVQTHRSLAWRQSVYCCYSSCPFYAGNTAQAIFRVTRPLNWLLSIPWPSYCS